MQKNKTKWKLDLSNRVFYLWMNSKVQEASSWYCKLNIANNVASPVRNVGRIPSQTKRTHCVINAKHQHHFWILAVSEWVSECELLWACLWVSESEQVSVNDMPRYMRYLAQKIYVLHSFNFTETLHYLIYYIALLNKTNMFICKSLRQSWMFFSNTDVIVYIYREVSGEDLQGVWESSQHLLRWHLPEGNKKD